MTCASFIKHLDKLDNSDIPIDMIAHANNCAACAKKLKLISKAMYLYQIPDVVSSKDISASISALLPLVQAPKRAVSTKNWLITGLLILASTIFVPLLHEFDILTNLHGADFAMTVSMFLGFIITVYSALFILSHFEKLSTLIQNFHKVAH